MPTPEASIIATCIGGPVAGIGLLDYISYREGERTLVGMLRSRLMVGAGRGE